MSKAFTKDDAPIEPVLLARVPLPEGVTNYVTPSGLAALSEERTRWRAGLEARGPGADRDAAHVASQAHMAELDARIASAVVVDPQTFAHDKIRLGAWVTVEAEDGVRRRLQIVGIDEADAGSGRIAFVSPVGKALLGKRVGDEVSVRAPKGKEKLEVLEIAYDSA